MPKIVDHDQRRQELAGAAVRIIARGGLEAATTRAVADEAGWSTGVLKHYFDGKDELLRHALAELERRNLDRLEAGGAAGTGFDAIVGAIHQILAASDDESRVWIAFTARAAGDRGTAATMSNAIDVWVERWAGLLRRGQADGSVRRDLDADAVAREIHALVNGLRMRATFQAEGEQQITVPPTMLDALRPTARADAAARTRPGAGTV